MAISYTVEADPELGRLALGLWLGAGYRVWLVARELTRRGDGSGKLDRQELRTALRDFGVVCARHNFNRILREGRGLFWSVSPDKRTIFLRSYHKVATHLTARALSTSPDLVETNQPGQPFKTAVVSGSHADFEASVFWTWLDYRQDRGLSNISYETLSRLFDRSDNTLRDWMNRVGIERLANYAQYAGEDWSIVPSHATPYLSKDGEFHLTWRIANRHRCAPVAERAHKRVPFSVGRQCRYLLDCAAPGQPARLCGLLSKGDIAEQSTPAKPRFGGRGFYRTGRLYFTSKSSARARRKVYSHWKRHQDYQRRHYARLGTRRGLGVYECVDPNRIGLTRLRERDFRAEWRVGNRRYIQAFKTAFSAF